MIKILIVIAGLVILMLVAGLILPRERTVSREGRYNVSPQLLYSIVTDNTDWHYRTGLKNLIITQSSGDVETWEEQSEDGSVIRFKTREKRPYSFYSFDIEAKRFTGYWTGEFEPDGDSGTIFTATEHITVRNPFVKLFSYIFFNVGKFMDAYQSDLHKKVAGLPDIFMSMKAREYPINTDAVELTLFNNSSEEIYSGAYYDIYRKTDAQWEKISFDMLFIDIAYIIKPGGSMDFSIRLPHDSFEFVPGEYRIIKNSGDRELSADFILK